METNKNYYRNLIKRRREDLASINKEIMDGNIFRNVVLNDSYIAANRIFIYVSFGKEPDTYKIIEHSLDMGKLVFVPKVLSKKEGMLAIKINSLKELKLGYFGIMEPKLLEKSVFPDKIDLNIIPGVAFDKNGNRIGYGGGFYDRFLGEQEQRKNISALAYEFQIFSELPSGSFDIKVTSLITEKTIYHTIKNQNV